MVLHITDICRICLYKKELLTWDCEKGFVVSDMNSVSKTIRYRILWSGYTFVFQILITKDIQFTCLLLFQPTCSSEGYLDKTLFFIPHCTAKTRQKLTDWHFILTSAKGCVSAPHLQIWWKKTARTQYQPSISSLKVTDSSPSDVLNQRGMILAVCRLDHNVELYSVICSQWVPFSEFLFASSISEPSISWSKSSFNFVSLKFLFLSEDWFAKKDRSRNPHEWIKCSILELFIASNLAHQVYLKHSRVDLLQKGQRHCCSFKFQYYSKTIIWRRKMCLETTANKYQVCQLIWFTIIWWTQTCNWH